MIRGGLNTVIRSYVFLYQAEDGIRDLVRSRGLGDVYKRQGRRSCRNLAKRHWQGNCQVRIPGPASSEGSHVRGCLLYTSDAADERSSVDLGGRRIIKKKKK